MKRPARLLWLLLALAVVGCGSSSPSPAAGTASAAPPVSAAPSVPAASAGAPSPSAAAPSATGGTGVGDLRALLPTSIAGHALHVTQFSGADFATGGASQEMVDLLASLGRTVTDMTLAMATDQTKAIDLNITAFRVRDVPVTLFLQAYLPMIHTLDPAATTTQGTRGGRSVYTVVPKSGPLQVLVTSGDVLFVVASANPALIDEALSKLP